MSGADQQSAYLRSMLNNEPYQGGGMKSHDIPDFQAPPPIPKLTDAARAIDELPSYDSFRPIMESDVELFLDDF